MVTPSQRTPSTAIDAASSSTTAGAHARQVASIDHLLENDLLADREWSPVDDALFSTAAGARGKGKMVTVRVRDASSSSGAGAGIQYGKFTARWVSPGQGAERKGPMDALASLLNGGRSTAGDQGASSTSSGWGARAFGPIETGRRGVRPT